MLDDRTIQSAVARLVAAAAFPSQVILFGSYARGTAIELRHRSARHRAANTQQG
jgi:hypothetical protein